jgi:FtsH-binding integral membrane protein
MTNALPPAHWAADPSGRHEYRYWDGARWTDHVADQGRPSLDPIISEPAVQRPAATSPEPAAEPITPEPTATEPTAGAGAAPSIAWRPDTHGTADSPAADATPADSPPAESPAVESPAAVSPAAGAAAPDEAAPMTWPPELGAEADGPPPTEAGWAAPTPVVPVAPAPAPAPAPTPTVLAPPPPPPVAGTGFVTAGRMSVYGATAWRAMSGLKTALVVLFIGMALSSVALLVTFLNRISAINDFQNNRFAGAQPLRDADDAVSGAASFYTIFRVAIIVVFIIWMWRASKNALEVLGRERPTFTPGWSIGGWFIPLANFVIPVMIIQGLWRASAPGTAPGTTWRDAKGSGLVIVWWIAFLGSTVASFTFNDNNKLNDVKVADTVGAVGAAASVVAAVLAISVVVQLTRRFDERRVDELGA